MLAFNYYLIVILVLGAFIIDVKTCRIPNQLVIGGVVAGILYHLWSNGLTGIIQAGTGMLIGFGIVFILYLVGGMGAGDVKLFAAIGALGGSQYVVACIIYSILCGGVIGLFILLYRQEFILRLKNILYYIFCIFTFQHRGLFRNIKEKQGLRFPFMYAVLPGAIIAYFYVPVW